jgi:hypothetical protein
MVHHPNYLPMGLDGASLREPGGSGSVASMRILPLTFAALLLIAADATAATYVANPAGGGRIAINVEDRTLRRVKMTLPARCESNTGRVWETNLAVDLRGNRRIFGRRFRIQGKAANDVRYHVTGRLLGRTMITGRARLTLLALGPAMCDTSVLRYRARLASLAHITADSPAVEGRIVRGSG